MDMVKLRDAAKYFLVYSGQRGTEKQIDKLIKQSSYLVFQLATARGWKG